MAGATGYGGLSTSVPATFPSGAPITSVGQNQSQSAGQKHLTYQPLGHNRSPTSRTTQNRRSCDSIAQQAQNMAPQVYQWGMDQYNKNQGNIDAMMRNALAYAARSASPPGDGQGRSRRDAGCRNRTAERDQRPAELRHRSLQRALCRARPGQPGDVGRAAAGAGNQQRDATMRWRSMATEAQGLSEQNYQTGYGASRCRAISCSAPRCS